MTEYPILGSLLLVAVVIALVLYWVLKEERP